MKKYYLVSILLIMSFALFACATSTPTPIATALPTQSPVPITQPATATAQVEDPWVEQAKAEGGQLMVYTSMNAKDLDKVLAKFKETYPFVNIQYFRDTGENVIVKGLTEAQAGQYVADVYELDSASIGGQVQTELLAPFVSPESEAYSVLLKDPGGYWTMDRINTVVVAYNTNLVDPADAPKTWEDLLDPKWRGKMAVEHTDIELLGDMASVWGQARAYVFWDGIAAQKPAIVDGHTELAEALAAGTYAISPTTYAYRIEKLKADGQPIEWVRTDPVFAFPTILSLANQAPHPATAKLFINWLLSESGQTTIRDLGRIPARPGISSDPPALTEGLNLFYTPISVTDHFAEYTEKWNNLFASE